MTKMGILMIFLFFFFSPIKHINAASRWREHSRPVTFLKLNPVVAHLVMSLSVLSWYPEGWPTTKQLLISALDDMNKHKRYYTKSFQKGRHRALLPVWDTHCAAAGGGTRYSLWKVSYSGWKKNNPKWDIFRHANAASYTLTRERLS